MAILNGSIDKILSEDRKLMQKYLKGTAPVKIEGSEELEEAIEKLIKQRGG